MNYSNELDDLLCAEIADFNRLPDNHQDLLRGIAHYLYVSLAERVPAMPLNFHLNVIPFLHDDSFRAPLPHLVNVGDCFDLSHLLMLNPWGSQKSRISSDEVFILSEHYSKCGRSVLSAAMESSCYNSFLIALDIFSQREFLDVCCDYDVWAVQFPSVDLLSELDFLRKIKESYGSSVAYCPIYRFPDVGFLVKLAYGSGCGFFLELSDSIKAFEGCGMYVVVPASDGKLMRRIFKSCNLINFGSLVSSEKTGTLICGNQKIKLPPFVLDNLLLSLSKRRSKMLNKEKSYENSCYAKGYNCIGIANSVSRGNSKFTSSIEIGSRFNSSFDSYNVKSNPTPYGCYHSIKGVGRFLVSLSAYTSTSNIEFDKEKVVRMIFEHNGLAGRPIKVKVKILASKSVSETDEIRREFSQFFDIFPIASEIEVEDSSSDESVVAMALISKVNQDFPDAVQKFKNVDDVIFALNYNMNDDNKNAGLLLSGEEVERLVSKKIVNAICPVSSAGVLGTLFFMGYSENYGFDITTFDEMSVDAFLNEATIGHLIATVPPDETQAFVEYMAEQKIPAVVLGHVVQKKIIIDDAEFGTIANLKKKASFAFWNKLKMMDRNELKPYSQSGATKKEQVAAMFDNIAPKYDFLNHFLSIGIDKLWRRRLVRELRKYKTDKILDIATGTGDLAIALTKLKHEGIVGIDLSAKMVAVGIEKIKKCNLDGSVLLMKGDSESIAFDPETFDAVTVAFGVRNFENTKQGISEMYRVLKKGGVVSILEFSMPQKFPVRQLYKFYFFAILPIIGRLFSKDKSAYTYLPESVEAFPHGTKFTTMLEEVGFSKTRIITLSFGIASIYIGEK